LETLSIDMYIEPQGNRLKREAFPFKMVGDSIAKTVLSTLEKLYAVPNASLKAVVVQCLGFFLCGHRAYMKEQTVAHTLALSLTHSDMAIRLRALETMSRLLAHFGREAEKETKSQGKADTAIASAVESAQPLQQHFSEVLVHITVAKSEIGKLIVHRTGDDELLIKIRIEALTVLRYLHQQGLINPMNILSKVFALAFSSELPIAEPASLLLKDILEVRPTMLINRLDDALHDAFLAALAGSQPPALGQTLRTPFVTISQLYADIFRRTKSSREMLIRKLLQQVLRLSESRFQKTFNDLLECSEHPAMASKKRRLVVAEAEKADEGLFNQSLLSKLPPLRYYQMLYAQFIAAVLTALPFQYEGEPLLVIYECNRHLSLTGAPLSAAGESAMADPGALAALVGDTSKDSFAEAVSVMTCLVLKSTMKVEYGLNAEQCVQYNPKDLKQEKLKSGLLSLGRRGADAAAEEAAPSGRIIAFPVAEWSKLTAPLAAKHDKPAEIAKVVSEAMDNDPWDSSFSRYAEKLDKLEGRTPTNKRKEKSSGTSTGRGGRSAGVKPGRGSPAGRARGRGGRAAKKQKVSAAAAGQDEEEDDDEDDIADVDDSEDEDYNPKD
jgi:hypothetical protein